MKILLHTIGIFAWIIALSGCVNQSLPKEAKVQVNVPDEPHPGTRTKVVTFDVRDGRDAFVQLFNSAKRVGMCSPTRIEESNGAYEVMTVSYWGEVMNHRLTFYILKNQRDEWITSGYGGVEIYDHPEGFPEYRYSRSSLEEIKTWYEKHVPQSDRKR